MLPTIGIRPSSRSVCPPWKDKAARDGILCPDGWDYNPAAISVFNGNRWTMETQFSSLYDSQLRLNSEKSVELSAYGSEAQGTVCAAGTHTMVYCPETWTYDEANFRCVQPWVVHAPMHSVS